MFSLNDLNKAAQYIYKFMPPTPQYKWPLLYEKAGLEVWVKHENHTPTGAFKIRGSITFMDWLMRSHPDVKGVVTATRGNHGQSQSMVASAHGLKAKIIVPHGNSIEKNNAMRAFGGDVIEFGQNFDDARLEAARIAEFEKLFMVPPFHQEIIRGVSSYALELFSNTPELDVVYVPIGCGSGICSLITVRDLLALKTEIVGVVSTEAEAAKISFESGKLIASSTAKTFADGMAVTTPVKEAFEVYLKGASRIVSVSEYEVAKAMRLIFSTTHNVAEGAGAAALAAAIQERESNIKNKNVAVILTGGNVDTSIYATVLQGETPVIN